MLEIESADVQSKAQADTILEKYEEALSVRQFLLTNSVLKDHKVTFRVPLETLKEAIPAIGDFPFLVRNPAFLFFFPPLPADCRPS